MKKAGYILISVMEKISQKNEANLFIVNYILSNYHD